MRIKFFCATLVILTLNTALSFAQCTGPGCPCGGGDDDGTCGPLDTWVVVLAVGAFLFVIMHLYRKQKNLYPGKQA
ncbi:MAG TPA: hypothetical protein VGI43_13760 [Mucilaginibacter sp.]|jgi:hypothetical protein